MFDARTLVLEAPAAGGKGTRKPSITQAGRDLEERARKYEQTLEIEDVIRECAPERARGQGSTGLTIECPYADGHSDVRNGSDTGCFVVNAGASESGYFVASCRHASCEKYSRFDMAAKMVADGWFPKSAIEDEYNNAINSETNALVAQMTPDSVAEEIKGFGSTPTSAELQRVLDRIEAVEDEKTKGVLFATAEQNIKGKALKGLVAKAQKRAKQVTKVTAKGLLKQARAIPGCEDITASEGGGIGPTFANCLLLLERAHGEWGWAYDELAMQPKLRQKKLPWSDKLGCDIGDDLYRVVRHFLIEQWGVTFKREDVREACLTLASYTRFNPVLEYLDGLKWDGRPRVETWLTIYLSVKDTPYARGVGKTWLVAAVRRARKPGCKFDYVLILEGKTRTGKSTALKILAKDWFSDSALVDVDKPDAAMKLRSKWIYELAELRDIRKGNSESLKGFFSRNEDYYRAPYDTGPMTYPRRCIFAGSTEIGTYLIDLAGNARYWPVRCGEIKNSELEQDRDQIWAEAAHLEAEGFPIVLDSSLWAAAAEEQEQRLSGDPWVEKLREELDSKSDIGAFVYTTDLLTDVIGIELKDQTPREMGRLRTLIEACFPEWDYSRDRQNGNKRGYKRACRNLSPGNRVPDQ